MPIIRQIDPLQPLSDQAARSDFCEEPFNDGQRRPESWANTKSMSNVTDSGFMTVEMARLTEENHRLREERNGGYTSNTARGPEIQFVKPLEDLPGLDEEVDWKGPTFPNSCDLSRVSLKGYYIMERPEWVALVQLASFMGREDLPTYTPAFLVGRFSIKHVELPNRVVTHLNLLIEALYKCPVLVQTYREYSELRTDVGQRVAIKHGSVFFPVTGLAVAVSRTEFESITGYEGGVLRMKHRWGQMNHLECIESGRELYDSLQQPENRAVATRHAQPLSFMERFAAGLLTRPHNRRR